MTLHIPTLVLASVLGSFLIALAIELPQDEVRARPELRRWAAGTWAMLAGMAVIFCRPLIPPWFSIVFGNGLIALGLALYVQAIHMLLRDSPPPRWPLQMQPLIWLAFALIASWPLSVRTTVVSFLLATLLTPAVLLANRGALSTDRSVRALAYMAALAAAALWFRGVHALWIPEDYEALNQVSTAQVMTFLLTFLGLVGAGLSFLLAVYERVTGHMERLASHDGMTGCLNRSTTDALLAHELQRVRRDGRPLAFVLLDLDQFKQINDRHGHAIGDEVLRKFAQTVRLRLRASDAMGRTGGEEFGLVLPGTDAAGARNLVESIRLAVAESTAVVDAEGRPVFVTVSAGIALAAYDSDISADRLYGRADQALYEAKRTGRNRVMQYGDSNPAQATLLGGDRGDPPSLRGPSP